jgi:hypothetical protein
MSGNARENGTSPAPRRRRRRQPPLQTIADVSRELAWIYRAGMNGERLAADVSRLASVLQILVGAMRVGQLEERLEALEQALKRRP